MSSLPYFADLASVDRDAYRRSDPFKPLLRVAICGFDDHATKSVLHHLGSAQTEKLKLKLGCGSGSEKNNDISFQDSLFGRTSPSI